jgi:hypothetical protein
VTFPTFGWELIADEPDERAWSSGDGAYLSLNFFPLAPDLPSLDVDELEPMFGTRRLDDDSRPLLIELAVDRSQAIPIVRIVTRRHVPERDRYAFQAALVAPVARCSWTIKVARVEGDFTGVRESLAMDEYLRTHSGEMPVGPPFDVGQYTREWDDRVPDSLDALSPVRRCIAQVEDALTFGPEVASEPPFSPIP